MKTTTITATIAALFAQLAFAAPVDDLDARAFDEMERRAASAPVERGFTETTVEERASNWVTNGPAPPMAMDVASTWATLARYQSATYCNLTSVKAWSCADCNLLGGSSKNTVLMTGGDDGATPVHYVVNNGSHLIIGIRGTNSNDPASLANDVNFVLVTPSETYYPGIKAAGGMVHAGFYGATTRVAASLAPTVQAAVQGGTTNVIVLGHSLGGAVGQMLGVYLTSLLGSSATVYVRTFAPARVGNPAWADYVDATMGERSQHMVNFNDPVPHLPPLAWGFRHSGNEVFLDKLGSLDPLVCSGQENSHCADKYEEPLNWLASIVQYVDSEVHMGPYVGVTLRGNC